MIGSGMILTYLITFVVAILVLKIIAVPLRLLLGFAINIIVGGIILYFLINLGIIAAAAITWWMAVLIAVLGIPGVIIAVVLSIIL